MAFITHLCQGRDSIRVGIGPGWVHNLHKFAFDQPEMFDPQDTLAGYMHGAVSMCAVGCTFSAEPYRICGIEGVSQPEPTYAKGNMERQQQQQLAEILTQGCNSMQCVGR